MPRLVLLKDGQAFPFELERFPVKLGRHPECQIQLDSNMVSRFHAQVTQQGADIFLEDLKAPNKTSVNGRELAPESPQKLGNGDRIKLGPVKMRFESDDPAAPYGMTVGVDLSDDGNSTIMGSRSASGYGAFQVRPEDKLRGILQISQALTGIVQLPQLSPKILEVLFEIFPQADRGCILLREEPSKPLTPAAQHIRGDEEGETVRLSRTVLNQVLEEKKAILSADAANDSRFSASESITGLTIHSMMCVPLLDVDQQVFGVISIDTQNPQFRFTEDDLELLLAVATQAAGAYVNALLVQAFHTKQKQDQEMRIASGVQKALLPESLPEISGYRFYASYDAAQAVGGDYFDCFQINEDKICVSFGDVAGKGVPGALIMSRIASVVQSTMAFTDDVEVAIRKINNHMCHNMVAGRFVTYILAVIDLRTNRIQLTNAGHMSPVIRHADGSIDEFDDASIGIPVGILENYPYEVVEKEIQQGDLFVLITDGVDEAMNPAGELYTKERVREFIENGPAEPDDLGRELLTDVRRHAAGRDQNDDITIMTFGRL